MSYKFFNFLGLSLVLLAAHAQAATYFVRSGGSGNGTSWANAWGNVSNISWSALGPGDTVCVAGGTYSGSISFGKSGAAGRPITVKRATASDTTCGSVTAGWTAAYDAQAVISGITANGNFVTVDGSVWNGFKINVSACGNGSCPGVDAGGATSDITIRYVEISGPCNGTGDSTCLSPLPSGDPRGINPEVWNGSNYEVQNNWLIQYDNIHGQCDTIYAVNGTNWIIEHSRIADSMMMPNHGYTCHDNFFITNGSTGTFRYNEVTNWHTEGFLFWSSPSVWYIYGNVFHDPATDSYPRMVEAQNASQTIYFYNNTVTRVPYICANATNDGTWSANTTSKNNLYFGNNFGGCGIPREDYDYSDKSLTGEAHGQGSAANPFVNYAAKTIQGYHLTTHTNPGLNLGSPYNVDYDGNSRTTWDRGAFEYGSTTSLPNPPTNLVASPQ